MRFLLLIIICLHFTGQAEIRKIETLKPLEEMIPDLDRKNDFVLFDFSNTLMMPDDALLQPCGKNCLAQMIQTHAPRLNTKEIQGLISLILLQRKVHLVEDDSITLIKTLQNKEITTFCLTSLKTGQYGWIPRTEEWRKNELNSFGIDFKKAFPTIHYLSFDEYRTEKHPPVFIDGVLCSGSVFKGEVLARFFHKIKVKPKRVIFVDNSILHHDSVADWMAKLNIEYIGFHYLATNKKEREVDSEIAHFQIRYLIENKRWLSDVEVAKILNRQNSYGE